MSELTEQINEVTKDTEENRDCVDTLSRLPVADSPLISTDQTGMELKTSPAQFLTDSTTAFRSTPSPPRSFISTLDRNPLTTATSLRPNTSAETSLVLAVDASNANTNDLDFPPVQSSEVASCPASPMTPHQEITTETVITSPNVQFRSASGSNKLPPKTTQCSSPVTNPPHTVTTTASATVKRSRQKPDERRELLIRAVEDVLRNNISMRRAAQKHNLAKSSLCDFVRKNNIPLPNLRVKNCPPTSDCSSIPSLSKRVGTPTAATTTALGLKRVPSETNEFQPEVKLVCSADRKPNVLNKYRDPGTYSNENSPIGRTNSSHAVSHPSSTFSDSPLALDVLDSDHSVRKSPYTSTRSGHATSNSIAVTSSISSNAVSACTSSGGSTLLSTRSNYSTSKTNRIESPWYNSAGLPTQVPMRSWTVTHHPNSLNGNASTAGAHCNLYNEQKQRTNHSLSQLRQTLDKSGVVMNLSDPTSQVNTPTSNLVRNLTESTGNSAAETHGARQTPISEDGESGLTSDGSELLKKQPYDIHIPASSQPFQYCDMTEAHSTSEADRGEFRIELNGIGEPFLTGQLRLDSRPTSQCSSPQVLTESTNNTGSTAETPSVSNPLTNVPPQEFNPLVYSLPVGFDVPLTAVSSAAAAAAAAVGLSDVNWFVRSRESRLPLPNFDSIQLSLSSQPHPASNFDTSASIAIGGGAPPFCHGVHHMTSLNAATVPTPSVAPFLATTEFSTANPAAAAVIAALLLQQQSRAAPTASGASVTPCPVVNPTTAPIAAATLPNLIGYPPTHLTYPIPVPSSGGPLSVPTSNFATLYTPTLFSAPTDLTLPSISSAVPTGNNTSTTTGRLGSSRPPSVQSVASNACQSQLHQTTQPSQPPPPSRITQPNLSNLSVSDLLQLSAEDLHTLLTRSAATAASTQHLRPQPDPTGSSSVFTNTLSTQLLPHMTYPAVRQFLAALLGSVLPKTVNLMSNLNARPSNTNTASTAAVTAPDNLLPNPLHLQDTCSNLLNFSMSTNMTKMQSHAKGLIDFINKSPSPFHAVQAACDLLTANGFRELKEHEPWKLRPSDCVFIRKNGTTVVAAAVGGKFKPGNPFHMIGAHTDSPCLRLKPFSERVKEGYIQLGVETYGGGLWYTWFDRELKVAGRAVTANAAGRLEERLVHLDRPIACVPSLAIHLNQEIKVQGFQPNTEQHVAPILCTCLMDQVQNVDGAESAQSPLSALGASANASPATQLGKRRHPTGLLRVIAQDLGVSEHDILELELYFADCQPARIGGLHNEFIHAPRLDNLFNSYTSVCGLVGSLNSLGDDSALRLVCLFDHEEIGSTSTQGANSAHTLNILRRLVDAVVLEPTTDAEKPGASCEAVEPGLDAGTSSPATSSSHFEESLSKSFLLSADQAHAVHPSYHERHEPNHKAQLHCGLILKYNSAQRYATNALTAAAVRQVAQRASVPVQEFTPRQDMHCGSTIGPLLSSQLGVPTADVGFPQLAMHSCRELCCTTSVSQAVRFYSAFYEQLPKLWPPERS